MKNSLVLFSAIIGAVFLASGFVTGNEQVERKDLYKEHCQSCHMKKGKGFFNSYPPLTDTTWVGDNKKIVTNIIAGISGEIVVNGKIYNNEMPAMAYLTDAEIAEIVNYIREDIVNMRNEITKEQVAAIRAQIK